MHLWCFSRHTVVDHRHGVPYTIGKAVRQHAPFHCTVRHVYDRPPRQYKNIKIWKKSTFLFSEQQFDHDKQKIQQQNNISKLFIFL